MELQLSSGSGPAECELGVALLMKALRAEFPGIKILGSVDGHRKGCYRSVRISCSEDLSFLDGTVLWICQSPYRPHHGRKNWFIDISVCHSADPRGFDESSVRFDTFRSGGRGGQNVNKVETGVRAVHIPTGISAVFTGERSQHINKRTALRRLRAAVESRDAALAAAAESENRLEHTRIKRGSPVRVYVGMEFRLTPWQRDC